MQLRNYRSLIALLIVFTVAVTMVFAGPVTAQTEPTGADPTAPTIDKTVVVDDDDGEDYTSIQDAIDTEGAKTRIEVRAGTYNEVTINVDDIEIVGAGSSDTGTVLEGSGSGNGIIVDASFVSVQDLRIKNYGNGIRLTGDHSDVIFDNVYSTENSSRGLEVHNDVDLQDLLLDGVSFSNNSGDGLRAATSSSIDGLSILNSQFDDNLGADSSGIEVYQSEGSPGQLNDVLIKDTTFNNNGQKGLYTEKLSYAVLENVTVDGVESDTNGFNTGIDINLKYGDYQNITIRDSVVANVSEGNPSDPSFAAGIAIKARGSSDDDSSYTSSPATLDGVTIENVTVKDSFNGLRFGEVGVDYNNNPGGATDVTVTNSTFQNNERYHIEDLSNSVDLATVEADNAFDRIVASEVGIYSSIQAAVDTAESGDTIEVATGNYDSESWPITIDKSITLTSEDGSDDTTINASGPAWSVISVEASDVTVKGFTLKNKGNDGNAERVRGIHGNKSSDGLTVNDVVVDGVSVGSSSDRPTAFGMTFLDNSTTVKNSEVKDVSAPRFAAGIRLGGDKNTKVSGGTLSNVNVENIVTTSGDTATGIYLVSIGDTSETVVEDSSVSEVTVDSGKGVAGIALDSFNADANNPNLALERNEVTGLSFNDATEVGLSVEESKIDDLSDVGVHRNDFSGNDYGVANQDTDSGSLNATSNWWGSTAKEDVVAQIEGDVNYSPWLNAPYPDGEPMTGDLKTVNVTAAPQSLVAKGKNTTTITATVLNDGGVPMSGISLSFDSQSGEFAGDSTATTGEDGKASVTLTAPDSPDESTVKATTSGGTSGATTVFFKKEGQPDVEASKSEVAGKGEEESTVDARKEANTVARTKKKKDSVDKEVATTVAKYDGNPGDKKALNTGPGGYLDVHVNEPDAVEEMTMRVYLDPWPNEPMIKYWDKESATWEPFSKYETYPDEGYVEGIITKDTDPSVGYLSGLPVAAGGLDVEYVQVENTGWAMVSAPLDPEDSEPEDVFSGVDSSTIFHYDAAKDDYITPSGDYDSVEALHGTWVKLGEAPKVFSISGAYSGNVEVELENPGWHQVGTPMDYGWSSIEVKQGSGGEKMTIEEQAAGPSSPHWMSRFIWDYSTDTGNYTAYDASADTGFALKPGKAYWVKTYEKNVELIIPGTAPPSVPGAAAGQAEGISMNSQAAEKLGLPQPPAPPASPQIGQAEVQVTTQSNQVTFEVLNTAVETMNVQVFGVSGKKLHASGTRATETYTWNPEGKLANGVYLYMVTANTTLGEGLTETGKLLVLN